MSSFVWMKVLESAPERYDRGIAMLSRGRIGEVYARIAELAAAPGKRVLDIGCGTGRVSLACAERGAKVTGIDIDAGMLEVARARPAPPGGSLEWVELGAAEIEDRFAPGSFDAVVSCLALSEMAEAEQAYVLRTALTRLVAGGLIVIADETAPQAPLARLAHDLVHWPLAAATYILTQTSTRPLADPEGLLADAGFVDISCERIWSGSFAIAQGRRAP